ncbi:MAG: hypothetical protein M3430_13980 [Acidobacteriota bacterium]|nr:hypothetical protein [Acidobacteriota bacterium]
MSDECRHSTHHSLLITHPFPFQFWGECGTGTVRKNAWLLKHGDVERLVVFKINYGVAALASELRAVIEERYRAPGRLLLVNFVADIAARTTTHRRIARVPQSWYTTTIV